MLGRKGNAYPCIGFYQVESTMYICTLNFADMKNLLTDLTLLT